MWKPSDSPEYQAIAVFYGDRTANRSGVPLINHIDEGLLVLQEIGASQSAQKAFCLHPLFQKDEDLRKTLDQKIDHLDPRAVALAMEYRRVANSFLNSHFMAGQTEFDLSPIKEVNQMLVADKVQNKKDFLKYHKTHHPHAGYLSKYFDLWISKLELWHDYERLEKLCDQKLTDRVT